MIGDVVAVGAARTGLEVGRSIDVTNPEFGEVRRKSGCVLEAKAGMKLQPVGSAGIIAASPRTSEPTMVRGPVRSRLQTTGCGQAQTGIRRAFQRVG